LRISTDYLSLFTLGRPAAPVPAAEFPEQSPSTPRLGWDDLPAPGTRKQIGEIRGVPPPRAHP